MYYYTFLSFNKLNTIGIYLLFLKLMTNLIEFCTIVKNAIHKNNLNANMNFILF